MAIRRVLGQNSKMFCNFMARNYSSSEKTKIGFIGVGEMGHHMASNLILKGFSVQAYDISGEACEKIAKKGAKLCKNLDAVDDDVDFVISMLPSQEIVKNTYEELFKDGAYADTIYIDSSTIGPCAADELGQFVRSKRGRFVDAPVSGSVMDAKNRTLTFLVGGNDEEFKLSKKVLSNISKRVIHCGKNGNGQAASMCNNLVLAISMCGVAECMNLAIRLGLNPEVFSKVINSSSGQNWCSKMSNPVPGISPNAPANFNYNGGLSVGLMLNDLILASDEALASDTPIMLGDTTFQFYRLLDKMGMGKKDCSVIYEYLKHKSKNEETQSS